jgi:pimeloyl-ACP methyl ester carboxylesterase
LLALGPRGAVRGIVLLAHGGRKQDEGQPGLLAPAALRMWPFALDLHRVGRSRGLLTCLLGYRMAGYNQGDPVADVEAVVATLAEEHPGAPVCLVGHSMGARACLRAAGGEGVRAVAGLASWLPPGEPVAQLAGREVLLADALADRVVNPAACLAYAERAQPHASRLCRLELRGANHSLLRRAPDWHALVRGFTLHALGLGPADERLERAFALPGKQALRVPF